MFHILADSGSTKTDWVLLRPRAIPRRSEVADSTPV